MSENKEAQEDELLALASIYDEEEFHRAESAQGGEIQLCLELPPDFKVVAKGTLVSEALQRNKKKQSVWISALSTILQRYDANTFHKVILSKSC